LASGNFVGFSRLIYLGGFIYVFAACINQFILVSAPGFDPNTGFLLLDSTFYYEKALWLRSQPESVGLFYDRDAVAPMYAKLSALIGSHPLSLLLPNVLFVTLIVVITNRIFDHFHVRNATPISLAVTLLNPSIIFMLSQINRDIFILASCMLVAYTVLLFHRLFLCGIDRTYWTIIYLIPPIMAGALLFTFRDLLIPVILLALLIYILLIIIFGWTRGKSVVRHIAVPLFTALGIIIGAAVVYGSTDKGQSPERVSVLVSRPNETSALDAQDSYKPDVVKRADTRKSSSPVLSRLESQRLGWVRSQDSHESPANSRFNRDITLDSYSGVARSLIEVIVPTYFFPAEIFTKGGLLLKFAFLENSVYSIIVTVGVCIAQARKISSLMVFPLILFSSALAFGLIVPVWGALFRYSVPLKYPLIVMSVGILLSHRKRNI
jgi:hypothetical protein